MKLAVTLRTRLSASPVEPALPKARSYAEESHRARFKESATLISPHPSTKRYNMSAVTRGAATPAFSELVTQPVLKVTPKPPPAAAESLQTRCARNAAMARWHSPTNKAAPVLAQNGLVGEATQLVPVSGELRYWRRGESKTVGGSYRQVSVEDTLGIIERIAAKELKWTELDKLYRDGRTLVSGGSIRKYFYGNGAETKLAKLRQKREFEQMGAPRQVLTEAQENYGMALIIEMALRRRPHSESELCRWASATAARNGTRTAAAPDMRAWYIYAKGRIVREFGINIEEVATQQLSKARAGVLLSGVRAWQGTIKELLEDKPELAAEGLKAHGNSDEMKLDLYEVLQRKGLVPEGCEAQWEVEGERCPQITFLGGFQGYLDQGIAKELHLPSSLPEVRELFYRARAGDATLDPELAKRMDIGQVAGYPKLPAGFWDCDRFCVLPGLLIFNAGDSAPDPAWSNLVHDKDRLLITSSESGYINTDLKHKWYKLCKAQLWCPWGKRPTLPTADHHSSNESIEMSAEMEADEAYLAGGPGHSTHLLQDLDQRGGPIQHFKEILGNLICHSYRVHSSLSRPRVAQAVELAYVLSFTPVICAYATVHVGWGEDEHGLLTYSPLECSHIVSKLVDDESSPSTATTLVSAPPTTESFAIAPAAERLALFKAGALDGHLGISAAREATREVLGKGTNPHDGWDNEGDMPEGVIDQAGAGRARRNRNDKGSIMGSAAFREGRVAEGKSAADKLEAARVKLFRERRIDEQALKWNSLAEGKLAVNAKLSNDEMIGFIRARTNEPVPQALKKTALLTAKLTALQAKPVVIKLSMEPDGYGEWLEQEKVAAVAANAAKAAKAAATAAAELEAPMADGVPMEVAASIVEAPIGMTEATPRAEAESEPESEFESDPPSESESESVTPAMAQTPVGTPSRLGLKMEIQGCDPNVCDYVCSTCDWELCIVEADNGHTCSVRIQSDDTLCEGVVAHRFLRMPPGIGSRKRKSNA